MAFLVDRPNRVAEKQRYFQALQGKQLVYQRGNGNLYFRSYMVLWTVAVVGSTWQLIQYGRVPSSISSFAVIYVKYHIRHNSRTSQKRYMNKQGKAQKVGE